MSSSNSTDPSSTESWTQTDTLAIVALVVSLVALFVTTTQVLQQIFGTAEGYRRCGTSAIGPWHQLRSRRWLWSELRFETIYYTPHVQLWSYMTFEESRRTNRNWIYPLDARLLARNNGAFRSSSLSSRKNVSSVLLSTVSHLSQFPSSQGGHLGAGATWLPLLEALHDAHVRSWPSREYIAHQQSAESTIETLPGISSEQRTWDFMPPDVVRPLATSTVGVIAILVQRLGMRWRILDIPNGQLMADGNGMSLSSSLLRGLGIVLRFDTLGGNRVQWNVIASEASDKLMCSILPGDPTFVGKDIQLRATKAQRDYAYSDLMSVLGMETAGVPAETYNEILTLLCAFLPLRHSDATDISCKSFKGQSRTVFHWWESRFALLQRLRARVEVPKSSTTELSSRLADILTHLDSLEKFHGDFYLNGATALIVRRKFAPRSSQSIDSAKTRELVETCRTIFQWTTERFVEWDRKDPEPADFNVLKMKRKSKYLDLLVAHASVSRMLNHSLDGWWQTDASAQRSYIDLRDLATLEKKKQLWGSFQPEGFVAGYAYADAIRHPDDGTSTRLATILEATRKEPLRERASIVKEYRSGRGDEGKHDSDDDIEVAWWTLMLRGIAWDMSVNNVAREDSEGAMRLPTYVYRSSTPLWIL